MSILMYAEAQRHTAGTYAPGSLVWTGSGATMAFYRNTGTTDASSTPPSAPWTAATGVYVGSVRLLSAPTSTWDPKGGPYEIVDQPKPTYSIDPMQRSGAFRVWVSDAAQRAALLNLLTSGKALRVVRDGATSDTDYCATDNGIPQVDVAALLPTSVSEEWILDEQGDDLVLSVSWREVVSTPPRRLP